MHHTQPYTHLEIDKDALLLRRGRGFDGPAPVIRRLRAAVGHLAVAAAGWRGWARHARCATRRQAVDPPLHSGVQVALLYGGGLLLPLQSEEVSQERLDILLGSGSGARVYGCLAAAATDQPAVSKAAQGHSGDVTWHWKPCTNSMRNTRPIARE